MDMVVVPDAVYSVRVRSPVRREVRTTLMYTRVDTKLRSDNRCKLVKTTHIV